MGELTLRACAAAARAAYMALMAQIQKEIDGGALDAGRLAVLSQTASTLANTDGILRSSLPREES